MCGERRRQLKIDTAASRVHASHARVTRSEGNLRNRFLPCNPCTVAGDRNKPDSETDNQTGRKADMNRKAVDYACNSPSRRDKYHLSQARAVLESNMSLISERRRRPGSSSNPPPPFPGEGGASNTSRRLRLIPWRRGWEGVLVSRPPSAPASPGALSSNVMPASGGPGYT